MSRGSRSQRRSCFAPGDPVDPVILVIDVQTAMGAGVVFYAGNEKVWLADVVPPEFIDEDIE
jgi:RNA:NAD 2'-phosphotransferase (TPT1/KptA family)